MPENPGPIRQGQFLVGKLDEGFPNRIWCVKGLSVLQRGDVKVWLLAWEPPDCTAEASVRFPQGKLSHGWRLLDLHDTKALLARGEKAAALNRSLPDDKLALAVLQAIFKGPE